MEKLSEVFTFRVPASLKEMSDRLAPPMKQKLNHDLRITIAKAIHESKFDPNLYGLGEDEEE